MDSYPTGSLVFWRRGKKSTHGPGLVIRYERLKTPVFPGTLGAHVYWPESDALMWTPNESLKFLVNTGSITSYN